MQKVRDAKSGETVEREVLASAVENAMARARAMAEGAKVTLGAIQRIENQSPPSEPAPTPVFRSMAPVGVGASAPATPVTPGQIEIHARVLVTIAIR